MTTPTTTDQKPSLRPLILVLLGMVGVVVVLRLMWQDVQPPEGKRVGNQCPEVAGLDADDKPVKLSDHKGKVVMISFWGTWCPPCRQQLPHEIDMVNNKYRGRPFTILGVARDGVAEMRAFLKATPLPWPNIVDDNGALVDSWNVAAFPSAVLVDHTGVIQYAWVNGVSPGELWAAVDRLVEDAERK
jgi:peroxiredoxin